MTSVARQSANRAAARKLSPVQEESLALRQEVACKVWRPTSYSLPADRRQRKPALFHPAANQIRTRVGSPESPSWVPPPPKEAVYLHRLGLLPHAQSLSRPRQSLPSAASLPPVPRLAATRLPRREKPHSFHPAKTQELPHSPSTRSPAEPGYHPSSTDKGRPAPAARNRRRMQAPSSPAPTRSGPRGNAAQASWLPSPIRFCPYRRAAPREFPRPLSPAQSTPGGCRPGKSPLGQKNARG